jgi:F0F1-type ATP synthase epsilon subunit
MKKTFQVVVKSPKSQKKYDAIEMVSGKSERGEFAVLAYHETFLSNLIGLVTLYKQGGVPIQIQNESGLLFMQENVCSIFLD